MTTTDTTARQVTIRNRAARDTLHQGGEQTVRNIARGMYDHTGIRYSDDDVNAAMADLIAEGQVVRMVSDVPGTLSRYSLTPRGTAFALAALEVEEAAEATVTRRDDERAHAMAAWRNACSETLALRGLRRKATERGESGEGLVIDGLLESALVRRRDAEAALSLAADALLLAQKHLAAVRIG